MSEATHRAGHILDLVITRDSELTSLTRNFHVQDHGISDHSVVTFEVDVSKPQKIKKTIMYRNIKAVDLDALKQDISE